MREDRQDAAEESEESEGGDEGLRVTEVDDETIEKSIKQRESRDIDKTNTSIIQSKSIVRRDSKAENAYDLFTSLVLNDKPDLKKQNSVVIGGKRRIL